MKKIIIIQLFLFLVLFKCYSQGADTIVTNLQLKAGTIKIIVGTTPIDESNISEYIKWNAQFRANSPNDNANVTIDTALTTSVALAYRSILSLPAGLTDASTYINDFKTSVQSKRNTNNYLDQLLDAIEAEFSALNTLNMNNGASKLFRKIN